MLINHNTVNFKETIKNYAFDYRRNHCVHVHTLEAQHSFHIDTLILQVTSMNSDLHVIRVSVVICPLVRCLGGDPLNVGRIVSVWGRGFNNDHSVLHGDHPTIPCYTDSGLDHITLKDILYK